ncbi:MAG: cadherin repeat domain-containing protein, partial [Candidatus Portiera sp.]|nr:cadherin repeat domain-containing protein [Portiera sp.]
MNKLTMQHKMTHIMRNLLLLLISGIILVACSPPQSSEVPPAAGINVFSHNSYRFAPSLDTRIPSDGTNRPLASIFVNENEVKKLVGRRLGLTDDQTAIAGLTSANYTLSYRINAASTASAATFFSVEGSTDNFLQATISVADPVGAGLSLTGILNIVSSFQVEVSIKILPQDTNQADLKSFVQVTFQKQGPRLSLDNVFTNNIAGLNNNINLTPRAEVKENAIVTASASLSRRGNILSEYALRRNSDLAGLTLFLALRDLNDTNNDCGDGEIYLDNTDLRIKAARDYNYEVDPRPSYLCRIFASGDGLTYKPLAIAVSNSVATTIDERGNAITGTNVETIQDFALVRPSNDSSVDCSNANACYYADLDIQVANVDELPKIEFSAPNQQAFMGIREGVGVLDAYSTNNPSLASAIGLATATGFNDKANQLNITDRDWATGTTNPLPVAEVVVADVSPSHGRGIFSIEPNGIDNNNNWALFVDSTKLDYEAFSAGQLSPTGKAIYKVFIRATDDAVADGGGAKSFTTAFDFEVTDVIYRPLLVDSSSSSIEVLGATDAFTRSSDDIVMEGNVIYLLSGSQALRNSLHRVGSFAAIDPETGDDRNLEYSITSTSAAILENFALINNSPRGRRLIISGTGLAQGATATISLTATHKGLATATNQASIKLEVDDSRYEVDTILSASTPKFNTTIPQGKIIEGTTTATVTYPSNLTNIEELAGNYVTGEGDKLLFGFAPTSTLRNTADLRSLGIRFDNRKFDIAEDTGKISAKDDTIEFNNPGSYDLLVYTARKSDFDAATSENAFFSNNGTLYDLSIISVVVTDINSAPLAREANRRMINTEEPLAITIKEDRAKAGTEVARIFITDDNDKTTREFTLDKTSNPGLFNVNWVNNNNGVTGIITLARDLDYETNKDLNNPTYSLNVSDRGRYSFNTISDQATPVNPATDQETISIPIDFTLEDVNEAPQLMLMVDEGRISESAQIGDLVSPSNGAGDNTLFRITNLREINPTQLSYAIEGPFKDILDVKAMPANLTQNRILAELEVINANRLENLGDGRTFIATIRVTDAASRLTSRINLPIMIINDFSADFQISDDYLANLIINEQDVAEGKLEVQGFKIPAASISRDDDDNFAANRRLQSIIFDVTARPQSTLDPVLTKVNVFEVFRRGDNYLLRVTDRDFIENNLFGDLDLAIAIRRQLSAEDAIASSARGVVTINRATPKLISYAGATNDPRAALTPPVYSISYTQTAYAAAVSPSTEQEPTPASDIQLDLNNIRGLSADGLIAHNNFVYPTLTLRDENGRNYRNFIRRAASRSTLVNKNNNAVLDISNINSQIVRINLKLPQKFEQVSERFDILKEDGKGNLVDAIGEFENFFTLELINSTNNLPPQLQITQRVFNSTATEASGTEISGNYNALDTIPLFAGEETTQSIVMNYFIRSYAEPYSSRNAASYALAQFSVRVTATGQITQPTQEYLVSNLNLFPVPNEPGSVRFQWTNPANLTGTDLANLTLSVSSYSEETRGDGRIETTMTLDGTYLAVGLQSLNLPLSTGRYYEFSVTPNFSSAKQLGLIATSPRVFIGTNPNILSKFVVENIRTTLLTGDADGVSLSWTNPANLTGTDITAINLIINSYTAETGEADKTETTMTLIDGNLTSGPQSLNLTLATGRYYEFSLTPVFSSATQQGIKVTSSPRVLVPVPVVVSEFMVANITITHLTGDADGVSLSWTNPANLTGTDITAINLVINNYTAATGEEGKTETTMTLNGTYLRAGLQSLNLPLATGR